MMKKEELTLPTHRRGFLGTLAKGAAALGLVSLAAPLKLDAMPQEQKKKAAAGGGELSPADAWFNKVKGKHRVVFDATQPHEIFPFAWPKVFLMTNEKTGSPPSDCGVVVVLRHSAIGYAFEDRLWEKYKFGEMFKANELGPGFQAADAATATTKRNPFLNPKPGDFKVPGFGDVAIGINQLQADGVLFCVCEAAISVYSTVTGGAMKMDAAEVRKDWMSGLLPGVQPVPSGVWALGRAKEHGCAYIFAG